MKAPQPALVTDWTQEPLILSIERVGEIFGLSHRTIRTRVSEHRFTPPMYTHPMRWSRADLERAWSGSKPVISARRSA